MSKLDRPRIGGLFFGSHPDLNSPCDLDLFPHHQRLSLQAILGPQRPPPTGLARDRQRMSAVHPYSVDTATPPLPAGQRPGNTRHTGTEPGGGGRRGGQPGVPASAGPVPPSPASPTRPGPVCTGRRVGRYVTLARVGPVTASAGHVVFCGPAAGGQDQ